MSDKYLEVRRNTLIANVAKLEIAYRIIYTMAEDYQNFIPRDEDYEPIEADLKRSVESLKLALEKTKQFQKHTMSS